jgi:hypothetical protein
LKVESLTILAVVVFVFSSVMMAQAQSETSLWRDEMGYQSVDQFQAAGWTITHQAGVSFGSSGVILDGTQEDTAIHYSNHFPSGIYDWKVEDRSRWILGSHCGNSVTAITDKHAYTFMADGWYSTFVFYRDGKKTTFGHYQEEINQWLTLRMEKQGNQINMYFNGELKNTYTEQDTAPSHLVGVDSVSPWRGGAEYDYYQVWSTGANTIAPQTSLFSNPIVIGGLIGVIGVVVGGVVYFFVLGGSGAAGSAGASGALTSGGGTLSTGNTPPGSGGGGLKPPNPTNVSLLSQIEALQSQAQSMHSQAANLMGNPYTVAAGNALEAQATSMDAQAMHLQAQSIHNAAADLMSNPYTAAAGNAMEAQASAIDAQATQLASQPQSTKPPTTEAIDNSGLISQIDDLQSQAQSMHNTAANLMSNPYTAAAGNAMNAQATSIDAQALQLQAQAMHNQAANLMSNPYTAAAGNAMDSQASAIESQAAQLQSQPQTVKPPTTETSQTNSDLFSQNDDLSQAQALHNQAATLMSNPYTVAAGNALEAQANSLDAQALQQQSQPQTVKPPNTGTNAGASSDSTTGADSSQSGSTTSQSDSGGDYSGGNASSDSGSA